MKATKTIGVSCSYTSIGIIGRVGKVRVSISVENGLQWTYFLFVFYISPIIFAAASLS